MERRIIGLDLGIATDHTAVVLDEAGTQLARRRVRRGQKTSLQACPRASRSSISSRSDEPAGKREIARAFGLNGADKIALKALLKDMADEGLIDSAPGRAFHKMGGVPKVTVLRVADVDDSGTRLGGARTLGGRGPPPRLRVQERGKARARLGDRVLARTEEGGQRLDRPSDEEARTGSELVLGVVHRGGRQSFWLQARRQEGAARAIPSPTRGEAEPGDLVLAEKTGGRRASPRA